MTTFAVCTTLYEAARAFLPAYMAGLRQASAGEDVSLIVVVDDLSEPAAVLSELGAICPVSAVYAAEGETPARIRRRLFAEAIVSSADILIFVDMDDVLAPDAPGLYAYAVENAQFAYGDMNLIDATGQVLGRRFFDDAHVPWRIEGVETLLDRNFLGLSNTAIRRDAMPDAAFSVPDDVIAVDWWLFTTLLMTGCKGQRVPQAVSDYRTYGANTLGAGGLSSRADLLRFLEIARRHYQAFPGSAPHLLRRARLESLANEVSGWTAHQLAVTLAGADRSQGVWFEFLGRLQSVGKDMASMREAV
ncbi:MAG: hypothetical protein JJ899_07595 [Alphaproteobacteria bacterium]|nr:hypothetical protein [Alphaproteobacteria bacterium]